MPWIVKLDKDDFVGKWSLEHVQERGLPSMLVGFEMEDGARAARGRPGRRRRTRPVGRGHERRAGARSSARRSGWPGCPPSSPRRASRSTSSVDGAHRAGDRTPAAVLRPRRREAALVSDARLPLPRPRASDGGFALRRSPLERALARRGAGSRSATAGSRVHPGKHRRFAATLAERRTSKARSSSSGSAADARRSSSATSDADASPLPRRSSSARLA